LRVRVLVEHGQGPEVTKKENKERKKRRGRSWQMVKKF
jgi:hypothetical protein